MVSRCKLGQSKRRGEQHETSEAAKNGVGGVEGMRRHRVKAALVMCTCLLHPMGTRGDSPNYVGRELSDYNGKFGRGIKLEVNRQAIPQSVLLSALCISLPRTRLLLCLWHVVLDAREPSSIDGFLPLSCRPYLFLAFRMQDGKFWPGTTGSEWPLPKGADVQRLEKYNGIRDKGFEGK